jgi:hypothetical protein
MKSLTRLCCLFTLAALIASSAAQAAYSSLFIFRLPVRKTSLFGTHRTWAQRPRLSPWERPRLQVSLRHP